MNSIVVFLAIVGAISARTISETSLECFPLGIVNGVNASISHFNSLGSVRVVNENSSVVTGTAIILAQIWVITAASSVIGQPIESLEVRVGSSSAIDGGQVIKVSNVWFHEYDLALLKLKEKIVMNENVTVPTIARDVSCVTNVTKQGVVAGFGLTLNAEDSPRLRSTDVTVVDIVTEADSETSWKIVLTKSNSNSGPTLFDWGSPLIVHGYVVGSYVADSRLPSQRNSSTLDRFIDITSQDFWNWVLSIAEPNH